MVNVLEQYDMEVLRTFKGRGTIICDTNKGNRVLKEYKGTIISVSYDRKYIKEVINKLYTLNSDGLIENLNN